MNPVTAYIVWTSFWIGLAEAAIAEAWGAEHTEETAA